MQSCCYCVSYCRQNQASETMNAFPPQDHGMCSEDRPMPAVTYVDPSISREHSQLPEPQQRDVCSNGDGDRLRDRCDGSPNASFRSHYSGHDVPAGSDRMMWHSQCNEEVRTQCVVVLIDCGIDCLFLRRDYFKFCVLCC